MRGYRVYCVVALYQLMFDCLKLLLHFPCPPGVRVFHLAIMGLWKLNQSLDSLHQCWREVKYIESSMNYQSSVLIFIS